MSVEGRAAAASLSGATLAERKQLYSLCSELESNVGGLALDLDVFMRHHAIKVETQVRTTSRTRTHKGGVHSTHAR